MARILSLVGPREPTQGLENRAIAYRKTEIQNFSHGLPMKRIRLSRIRTPGLRPRCTAVHPRTGATCDKPAHDARQSHRWIRKPVRPSFAKKKKFISFEARKAALAMVDDPLYRQRLLQDLRARRLRPAVECLLWYFAMGKPVELIRHSGALPLQQEVASLTTEELHARALALAASLKRG
jgi:hypothetical protein